MNPFVYNVFKNKLSETKDKSEIITDNGPKTFSLDAFNLLNPKQQPIVEFSEPILIEQPYITETNLGDHTGESTITDLVIVKPRLGKIEFASDHLNVGNMAELLNLFVQEGINVRVTSGVRQGAKTKSGRTSYHSSGDAIDITPVKGETFESLKAKIKGSDKIMKYMKAHGLGLIDETTPEMMRKTGATGAHFHIGKDNAGQVFFGQTGFKVPFKYEIPERPVKWPTIVSEQKEHTIPLAYDDSTWFDKVEKFQNAFEDFLGKATLVDQEDKSKPKQWLIGYGLSKIYDYKDKKWRSVREGDTLTQAQAEDQREKWYNDIFKKEIDRLKLYHFDEYPEDLKFQIFDLLYNTSGIEKNRSGERTKYMQELLNYESHRGFENKWYDLRKILEQADWSLSHKTEKGGHSSLGLRSVMRRNPSAIDYEDLKFALNKDKWDELWDKYNNIWNE